MIRRMFVHKTYPGGNGIATEYEQRPDLLWSAELTIEDRTYH